LPASKSVCRAARAANVRRLAELETVLTERMGNLG
jgi:hypothetical protein